MGKPEKNDSLGNRMKRYEQSSQIYLTRRMPVIIRIDGKAHHTFTRGLNKPFDDIYIKCMQKTMKYLCENIQGCVLGYTQSDEITLVLIDYQTLTSDAWFDYRLDKICTVSTSMATLAFNKELFKQYNIYCSDCNLYDNFIFNGAPTCTLKCEKNDYRILLENKLFRAEFDARAFNVPREDVTNCILWRQQDAERNSIQGLAQSLFSHKELHGLSCDKLQDKMMLEKQINWNDLPIYKKRGTSCIKSEMSIEELKEERNIEPYQDWLGKERMKWSIDLEMPILKNENRQYVDKLIYIGE